MNTDNTHQQDVQADVPVRAKQEAKSEPGTFSGRYFEPAVDIFETDDALTLVADLPGVEAADVETDIRDNVLTLSARVRPVDSKWKSAYREFEDGSYVRQFRLGQVIDQTRVTATLEEGVLTLVLPKLEGAKPRRIPVQSR